MNQADDAMQRFLEIEKKYGLYEAEACGVNYWNYARMEVWNYEICADRLALQEPHRKAGGGWKKNLRMLCFLTGKFAARGRHLRKPVELLIFSHNRRVKNGDRYECIYTEGLTEHFTSLTMERLYDVSYAKQIRNPDLLYMDYLPVQGRLSYLIRKSLRLPKYRRILASVTEQMRQPLDEMQEVFQCRLNMEKILQFMVEIVFSSIAERRGLEKIIRKTSPKAIVEVVNYKMQQMIAAELGKEYGIPVIELQHGTMHSEHAGYQFAEGAAVRQFPDYLFLFSEFWKTQIHVPIPEDHIRVTGFPYFERQLQTYRRDTVREDARQTVLFVSQGTIGGELSRIAVDLAGLLPEREYRILYKLHPGEYAGWRETYPWLARSGLPVYDSSETGIYELFAVSDVQVGVYSTAIYEGLGFGLRTLICRTGHWRGMQALIDGGYAESFRDVRELSMLLTSADSGNGKSGKVFWKENAMEHMAAEIREIIDKEYREKT